MTMSQQSFFKYLLVEYILEVRTTLMSYIYHNTINNSKCFEIKNSLNMLDVGKLCK